MADIWIVLLLAFLPGAGNFAGGMVAEFWRPSSRLLNWALHAASGIVIAIVATELMPQAIDTLAGWWVSAAFAFGGVAYLLLRSSIERLQRTSGKDRTSMWMIYAAVAIDLTSDGLMLGTGAAISPMLGIILAAGQLLADFPEGYATIANFRDNGVPKSRRMLLSASFITYVVGAAIASFLLLRGAPEELKAAALVFVAGLLTVAAVEDMLEEAHDAQEDNRRSVVAFVGGFALFTMVSTGLKGIA